LASKYQTWMASMISGHKNTNGVVAAGGLVPFLQGLEPVPELVQVLNGAAKEGHLVGLRVKQN
jgi:hypothetical protein